MLLCVAVVHKTFNQQGSSSKEIQPARIIFTIILLTDDFLGDPFSAKLESARTGTNFTCAALSSSVYQLVLCTLALSRS